MSHRQERPGDKPGPGDIATAEPGRDALPRWQRALAVVAHPDDATFALGAVLEAFAGQQTEVHVLSLTGIPASVPGIVSAGLGSLAVTELRQALQRLGSASATIPDLPTRDLAAVAPSTLAAEVTRAVSSLRPDGLLVFDTNGVSGHPDHVVATGAALTAAADNGLPVLGWTLPLELAASLNQACGSAFTGRPAAEIDLVVEVDRWQQRLTSLAHTSQAVPLHRLWHRLDLLEDLEYLVWLVPPGNPATRRSP